ncbi:MAG: hypothetical protein U0805_01020 [Pirellulales bacterium]
MRHNRFVIALLLLLGLANAMNAQQSVDKLIAKPDSNVQAQIQKLFNALQKVGDDPRSNFDVCREVLALKQLGVDKDELVEQLAIFVATTESDEDAHVLAAQAILALLDFSPSVPIRALAPYLDTDNRQLRDFARNWFGSHDMAHTAPPGSPPIKPVNYEDYLEYVEWKVTHKEEVPAGFIKFIYDRSPGRALLVFAYANSHGDVTARLEAIRKSIEARQQGLEPQVENGQQLEGGRQARLIKRSDIELAEHIVSNAVWLKKNKFDERFQAALPGANEQLDKLAKGEWWGKLYVVYIMRQNPLMLRDKVLRGLADDENEIVSKAAKSAD